MLKLATGTWCLLIVVSGWPIEALAYIDPGTGSMLIQGIIAAIAAVGLSLKLYWHRFLGLFRKSPRSAAPEHPLSDRSPADDRSGG